MKESNKDCNPLITAFIGEETNEVTATFMIDSGSCINTVTTPVWEEMKAQQIRVWNVKQKCNRQFTAYANCGPLVVLVSFHAVIRIDLHRKCIAQFYVISNASQSLIGRFTGAQLQVLRVGFAVNDISLIGEDTRFPMLPIKPVQLHLKTSEKPVKQLYFRVPESCRDAVIKQLKELIRCDIVECVSGPTAWISPMIVVPKENGDIRICIDMRAANKAIERIYHPLPTMEEIRAKLKGFRYFTKIDLVSAYYHIPLHEDSREITTFWSPLGVLRYKRMLFGINCAPEIFQRTMEELIGIVPGVVIYLDDILISGIDIEDHDKKLNKIEVLLQENKMKVNEKKCIYRQEKIEFIGFMISQKGIEISPRKVEAVREFRDPTTIAEIQSFLGLVNYMGHFIPNLTEKTDSLRSVIRSNVFSWETKERESFKALKDEIVQCTLTLGYFDSSDATTLFTDASPIGLGAVLVQSNKKEQNRIITCISKSLNETEKAYPQVHREALAVVWAMKRLYHYLIGIEFILVTDNQALTFIFNRDKDVSKRACNRAAAYALELQAFRFKAKHIEGKNNIADILSRLIPEFKATKVNNIVDTSNVNELGDGCFEASAITPEVIRTSLRTDDELQAVIKATSSNEWSDNIVKYRAFSGELYVWDDILWRSNRAVLPTALRIQAMENAHLGHPGSTTMKRILRERVWWPGMDKDIEQTVKECFDCTCVARTDPPEPLKMTLIPSEPWKFLAIDFFDASKMDIHLLVVVDYYSRYVWIKRMREKKAINVIQALEELIGQFDTPERIKADNGPPFDSKEFASYCNRRGIELIHSVPLWPQSNGEVEVQNRGIKRVLQLPSINKQNWEKN